MKKHELARLLAKQTHLSKAAAADRLDHVVHDILTSLRKGEAASLPGLGTFTPGKKLDFQFESRRRKRGARRGKN